MEDLKIYGINLSAIFISLSNTLNQNLESLVLLLTIVYTIIGIYQKINKNERNK